MSADFLAMSSIIYLQNKERNEEHTLYVVATLGIAGFSFSCRLTQESLTFSEKVSNAFRTRSVQCKVR
mgnify:CR=1 FL=1